MTTQRVGRFKSLCNLASVDMEAVSPGDPAAEDDPDRPRQRSASVEDAGMGDLLRFEPFFSACSY